MMLHIMRKSDSLLNSGVARSGNTSVEGVRKFVCEALIEREFH